MPIRLVAIVSAALLAGCVYKIDVQQGNVLEPEKVEQLEVGMDQRQVRFLLGDPVAHDAFRDDRWTYVYYFQSGDGEYRSRDKLTIYWDADGLVERMERGI